MRLEAQVEDNTVRGAHVPNNAKHLNRGDSTSALN